MFVLYLCLYTIIVHERIAVFLAYRNVLSVCSQESLPGEIMAIMQVRARGLIKLSRRTCQDWQRDKGESSFTAQLPNDRVRHRHRERRKKEDRVLSRLRNSEKDPFL